MAVHPFLDDTALDGLDALTAEGLRSMEPAELRRLTGLAAVDDIRVSDGRRGNGQGGILLRPGRVRLGWTTMWEVTIPTRRGRQPRICGTGIPANRPVDEARVVVVRRLARERGKRRLGANIAIDDVAAIDIVSFLNRFQNIHLAAPVRPPTTEKEVSRELSRLTRVYALERLRKAFKFDTLDDVRDGSLLRTYVSRIDLASSTVKYDLELLKRAVNSALKHLDKPSLLLTERIPRGNARAKPMVTVEDICRILLATAGCLWDKKNGCWKTETDPETGETRFVLAPARRRDALAVFTMAVILAFVTASRQNVLLAAKYDDATAPHPRFENGFFYRAGNSHVETNKPRGRVFMGREFADILAWAWKLAKEKGAEHILHKKNGAPYKALNADIWRETLEMLGIPYFSFHSWKAVCVQFLIDRGMTVIEIAEYTATSIETIMRNYKGVDATITHRRSAAVFDGLFNGGVEPAPLAVPAVTTDVAPRTDPMRSLGAALQTVKEIAARPSTAPVAAPAAPALVAVTSEAAPKSSDGILPPRGRLSETFLHPRGPLNDAEWDALAPLLREEKLIRGDEERKARLAVNAMIYVAVTGASWMSLSENYGVGDRIARRCMNWSRQGKIRRLRERVLGAKRLDPAVQGELVRILDGVAKLDGRARPAARATPLRSELKPNPLTDAEWQACARVMRLACDDAARVQFDAILWVAESGSPWEAIPKEMCHFEAARARLRIARKAMAITRLIVALERRVPEVAPLDDGQCDRLAQRFRALERTWTERGAQRAA